MEDPAVWITKNRKLLAKYRCKYVALSEGIVGSGDRLADVRQQADRTGKEYILYYVPRSVDRLKILPIHIKSLSTHEWQPLYPVTLVSSDGDRVREEALIDSGADITCMPFRVGADLGFERSGQEVPLKAAGIGGDVDYLLREMTVEIDGREVQTPVAWIQEEGALELIIGRAAIFDHFDITFRQADESIDFQWRG